MENFEGRSGSPEIKSERPSLGKRIRRAVAALGIAVLGASTAEVNPKMEIPNEIRSGDSPKPGEIPVPKPSTPQDPKSI